MQLDYRVIASITQHGMGLGKEADRGGIKKTYDIINPTPRAASDAF